MKSHFLLPLTRRNSPPLSLRNERTGLIVADTLETAFESASRNRGLLGRDQVPSGHALILAPTSVIHTFFMRFPIDVLIVTRRGIVLKTAQRVPARRVVGAWGGFAVVEMAGGSLAESGTQVQDVLALVEAVKAS